ncbi:hypothetical protein GCM10010387_31690 [Streptomyces inusitatus]|uniref:Uncharacterized protein n=1 Tax=Streptomyces inusitatus TaxID=68221 RepID=A0A918UUN3_9ACTN|nr:hypothetical protein [Streptomyces inusitatus]GGZ35287.1 hypothetical protein GCM10010387_31690 [Streptomyces inusitatus]
MHQRSETGAEENEERARRLDLSVPQVAGSALAAVAAAVLASRLGVYGTIIGAGVVSVVATCGGSVFQHLFSRTGEQLRAAPAGGREKSGASRASREAALPPAPGSDGEFGAATTHGSRVRGWKRPLIGAGVVFGVAMASITGFELASGSGLDGGTGTTVGSVVRGGPGGSGGPAPDERPPNSPDSSGSPDAPESPESPGSPGERPGERPDPSGSGAPDDGSGPPETPVPDPEHPSTGTENGAGNGAGNGSGPTEPSEPTGPTGPTPGDGSGSGTAEPSTGRSPAPVPTSAPRGGASTGP